ncbi:MFS transporter [Labedaea rhizosphaerae]|uniref:Putative MFS family arabinose efflux permease n=1 Tax=Labedaea rhizosphaerae TaxID=598644 RepID=A0A4R6SIV3_LABRH|nr:MFS transporter [Labedaea rhizosphaerae]TDQ00839.1 putative MFS family arabinose efflux permease [Labedaea rhizosphaerae]
MADAPSEPEPRGLPKRYWRLWWAGAIDNVGDGAFATAVPLLALHLTSEPVLVSAVSAAAFLPYLLVSLPMGALVDRRDRTLLMVSSQLAQAAVLAVVTVLLVLGGMNVGLLVVMAFALGVCEVVFDNSSQAILPDIVPDRQLHQANGYQNTATFIGRQFVGPPVGSFLFTAAAAAPFGLNALSFLGSAALIAGRRTERGARLARPGGEPMRRAIVDGLVWLWHHRLLRTLALLSCANTFCFAMGTATLVLLATQEVHTSSLGYGVLLTATALGGAVGGLVNAHLVAWLGSLRALLVSLVTTVVVFVAIGLAPNTVVLAALLAVGGFATTMWNVLVVSLRQQRVPSELRGRVNSVYRMIAWGLMPVGALAGGVVAARFGLRLPYPVAGAIRAVALGAALPVLVRSLKDSA